MQKWEYLTVVVGYPHTTDPNIKAIMGRVLPNWRKVSLRRGLNILGEDGWELVSIHWNTDCNSPSYDPTYIFKRPIDPSSPPVNESTYVTKWASL